MFLAKLYIIKHIGIKMVIKLVSMETNYCDIHYARAYYHTFMRIVCSSIYAYQGKQKMQHSQIYSIQLAHLILYPVGTLGGPGFISQSSVRGRELNVR